MQRGIRDHQIELTGVGHGGCISHFENHLREIALRGLNHLGRRVDANHLGAELRDLGGELAGPATHIENALARLGIQQHQQVASVLPHERMAGLVEFGIPGIRFRFHGAIVIIPCISFL